MLGRGVTDEYNALCLDDTNSENDCNATDSYVRVAYTAAVYTIFQTLLRMLITPNNQILIKPLNYTC